MHVGFTSSVQHPDAAILDIDIHTCLDMIYTNVKFNVYNQAWLKFGCMSVNRYMALPIDGPISDSDFDFDSDFKLSLRTSDWDICLSLCID